MGNRVNSIVIGVVVIVIAMVGLFIFLKKGGDPCVEHKGAESADAAIELLIEASRQQDPKILCPAVEDHVKVNDIERYLKHLDKKIGDAGGYEHIDIRFDEYLGAGFDYTIYKKSGEKVMQIGGHSTALSAVDRLLTFPSYHERAYYISTYISE